MSKTQYLADGGSRLAYALAYMFLLLFMNMYGFWRPFKVNIFTFLDIAESLTNALLFVGDAVLVVCLFVVGTTSLVWILLLAINLFRDAANELTAHQLAMRVRPHHQPLKLVILGSFVLGVVGFVALPPPYPIPGFLLLSSIGAGLAFAAVLCESSEQGWGRTIGVVLVVTWTVLPAVAFTRGAFAAYDIQSGCGDTRLSSETVARLALGDKTRLPVYLGHAGDNYIFYEDF